MYPFWIHFSMDLNGISSLGITIILDRRKNSFIFSDHFESILRRNVKFPYRQNFEKILSFIQQWSCIIFSRKKMARIYSLQKRFESISQWICLNFEKILPFVELRSCVSFCRENGWNLFSLNRFESNLQCICLNFEKDSPLIDRWLWPCV